MAANVADDVWHVRSGGVSPHGCRETAGPVLIEPGSGGLWHGAAWNYVVWGLLCANKVWDSIRSELPAPIGQQGMLSRIVAIMLTQLWVMFAWVFFRRDSVGEATNVLGSIIGLHSHPGAAVIPLELWIILIIAIDHTLGSGVWRTSISRGWARPLSWSGVGVLLALGLATMPLVQKPFIYFQF